MLVKRAPGQEQGTKQLLNTRWQRLYDEASTWRSHWQQLTQNFSPRRSVYLNTVERTKRRDDGSKINSQIYNTTPLTALRTLASGMMSGITSPARPWFRLTTPDPGMMEDEGVRRWVDDVQMLLHHVFSVSNLYSQLPTLYEDEGNIGTACAIIDEDEDDLIRVHTLTPGSYLLALDDKGRVNTLFREFTMTVSQLERWFGRDELSLSARNELENHRYDTLFDVRHAIMPKDRTFDTMRQNAPKEAAVNMPFTSVYWQPDQSDDPDRVLRLSGYRRFPAIAPRWDTTHNSPYGRSPGMIALADAKQLQSMERKKARLEALYAEPPMKGPAKLRQGFSSVAPGSMTYVDESQHQKYEPVYVPDPQALRFLIDDIEGVKQRINEVLFVDLFLMIASLNRREITAREIDERHEEKLLQLGPVIERLYDEALSPLINLTFDYAADAGLLPDPPEVLEGVELRIELISIMAAAQKLVAAGGIERLVSFAAAIAEMKPAVLDSVDEDKIIAEYAELIGVPADMLHEKDVVEDLRTQRAQQEQMAAGIEMAQGAAKAARDAGQAPGLAPEESLLESLIAQPGGEQPTDAVF